MIESREEIIKLLEEYTLKEYEVTGNIMSGVETGLEATYAHGVVLGKFREGDELTRKVVKKEYDIKRRLPIFIFCFGMLF